jgi:hypothetical protein
MMNKNEVENTIKAMVNHSDCIAWQDFGDRGNSCCGPFKLETQEEVIEDALALANVKMVMPKGTTIHLELARSVADRIGCKYVTYDWLIKIVGRIVAVSSYQDFCNVLNLSIAVQDGMRQRGLTEIRCIEEALA